MTEKYSDYLTGIELILYIGFGFERYPNYLTGFGLTLSAHDKSNLDLRNTQHKESLTEVVLILLNTGLELLNQPSRDVITKVWRLSWINCFLPFNIVLMHGAFTAPSFGNLYMTISLSTLLRFLCSSGYCMSLAHMSIAHLEYLPFLLLISCVQKNSPYTGKFNFPRSDIVWCEKPNVNVVK